MEDDDNKELLGLQLQVENIDDQLKRIKNEINDLLAKQDELNETRKRIFNKMVVLKEQPQCQQDWTSDKFEWNGKLVETAKRVFNINKFRALQMETMNVTLSNRDCILIMPTGGGKSLCFQLPALISPGFTLVISPLVSLMEDQVNALRDRNIDAVMLNASSPANYVTETQNKMTQPNPPFKLLYVTPEKIAKSKRFMAKLEKAYSINNINRIVIDEVHCASHWGHDFRPDYNILGILKRQFPNVPLLGLTATASEKVLVDIKDILTLDFRCIVFRASFNRSNLFYEVNQTNLDQKELVKEIAKTINQKFPQQSGIVYCFSRKDSEDVAGLLVKYGVPSRCYHADLSAAWKSKIHKAWSNGDLQVVVATIAFGMGIDKPNVRFIIHYSMSKSMENYYQESGRAGRDDQNATCILYFRFQDLFRLSSMVFTEKTGLQNLYNITRYSLDKRTCRRSLLGNHFAEVWPASRCHQMCDNCRKHKQDIITKDLRKDAESIIEILTKSMNSDERLTPLKVLDIWLGKGKVKLRPTNLAPYSREECEAIFTKLLLEEVMKEDFHFTPYTTILYVLPGPRWPLLKANRISVTIDVLRKKESNLSVENGSKAVVGSLVGTEGIGRKKRKKRTERRNVSMKQDVKQEGGEQNIIEIKQDEGEQNIIEIKQDEGEQNIIEIKEEEDDEEDVDIFEEQYRKKKKIVIETDSETE